MDPKKKRVLVLSILSIILLPLISQCSKADKSTGLKNMLASSSSSYLRSAANQPVHWQEWSDEAFILAKKLNRPIILDIGAVWCHWCHVMDRESYENEEIAKIINKNFIAIKVDRDERPDIDLRYQKLVVSHVRGGGWPLTCFLLPDGTLFFGGTYFPPEDRTEIPGLRSILINIASVYHEKRELLETQGSNLFNTIVLTESNSYNDKNLDDLMVNDIIREIETQFDPVNGGFGTAPKFPQPGALELIMAKYDQTGRKILDTIVKTTLDKMADGGINDQLGGGFHRYSVDEAWNVPHFEKISSVNAEILTNYIHYFQLTRDEKYKQIALSIINYFENTMIDQINGGFYASQDADNSLEDDGSYFTWTIDEIESILSEQEADIFNIYYEISSESGQIPDRPDQNVLSVNTNIHNITEQQGITHNDAVNLLEASKSKLLKIRNTRKTPYIDKTVYADINGMMVSAYIDAYFAFRNDSLKIFALKTLDMIIGNMYSSIHGFAHMYTKNEVKHFGLLDDQVYMANALIDGFRISGDIQYLEIAGELTDNILNSYEDKTNGGFFDRYIVDEVNKVLNTPQKQFYDLSRSSSNAIMVRVLNRMFVLTGNEVYRESAEKTLRAIAKSSAVNKISLSTFALALNNFFNPPLNVIIVGNPQNPSTYSLIEEANRIYKPGKEVFLFNSSESKVSDFPPVIREKMDLSDPRKPVAFVCNGMICAPPAYTPGQLNSVFITILK
ncbi:MAG: thioredoxin domain-containing protein [bacterium]|nr:thioredoxin domain-containing protein [bacterium]